MPPRSLHPLVYILLMWITLISIVQAVFIVYFFTLGQNGQSSSLRVEKPGDINDPPADLINLPSPSAKTIPEQGIMISYSARAKDNNIIWVASNPMPSLISEKGTQLEIKRDGFYFLSLRVTLCSCDDARVSERTVKVEFEGKAFVEGRIDGKTNSSGQLSKVKGLAEGGKLEVTINAPTSCINISDNVTHLDIIFMPQS